MKTRGNNSVGASIIQVALSTCLISISAILLVVAAPPHAKKAPRQDPTGFQVKGGAVADSITALGNYPDTPVSLSGDTTITPDAAPTNTTSINVSTNSNFNGTFAASPTTGVVKVTDAHPAGTYPVTVTAFGPGGATTKTFTLTVTSTPCGAGFTAGFIPAADVFVFSNPDFVAIGDFNGDGIQDLAVARSYQANAVSIRLGDGLGGFSGSTEVSVGFSPSAIAIGDFNGDGNQDLAVVVVPNKVSIRLGDGLGGFSGSTEVSVGSGPSSVAIGDFNGDGKQDLAVGNTNSPNTVSIRLGDGLGSFSGSTEVSVGSGPSSVAIGDFNGDGKQDLAAANYGSNSVSINLGDGLGGFSGSTVVTVGSNPLSLAIGDFNGDNKQDLAVANFSFGGSGTVSIRLGDGLGGFSGSTEVSVGNNPRSVAIGDFNGDGIQDLAVANANIDGTVSIALGDGLGGFSGPTNLSVGSGPFSVAIGDFNRDGRQDLAVAIYQNSSGAVSIRLGQCIPASTPTPTPSPTATATPQPPTLGNYPNTSIPLSSNTRVTPNTAPTSTTSINVSTSSSFNGTFVANPATGVVTVTDAHPAGTYTVMVMASGPAGTTIKTFPLTVTGTPCGAGFSFTSGADVHAGDNPNSVAIGDFNQDGRQDLTVANTNGGVSIRLGDGLGGFSGLINAGAGANPHSVAIGDFNGDGMQDLAVANADIAGTVSIDLGDGLGGFRYTTAVTVGSVPWSVTIGDFNGDSKQDWAVANSFANTVSIRLGDGLGGFSGSTEIGGGFVSVVIGDFNGDGKQDLAIANAGSSTVSIHLGDGLGGFSGPTEVNVGSNPRSVAIGDFNGDGTQDFAAANGGSNTVSIRLGDGLGGFSGSTEISVGSGPYSVAIGDFNGDGLQDFAVANYDSSTVSIRRGDGLGGFSGSTEVNVGSNPTSVAIGDFNGDGLQDFAVANHLSNPGTVSIRLGQCLPGSTPTPTPGPTVPAQSLNLSSRLLVQTGDRIGIAGLIITGSAPKRVIVRAVHCQICIPEASPLTDPVLELHGPGGFTTITNDNWRDTQEAEIVATGLAPDNNSDSAIVVTLSPGNYTASVRGQNNTSGEALVEVYDLDQAAASKLGNISTRAFVGTGGDILIAGFILGHGTLPDNVIVRGIGPSLTGLGVAGALADPRLELRDSQGALIRANNDWQEDPAQAALMTAAGLNPTNPLESGIAATVPPGQYTALLSGLNNGTGVGVVEVYDLGGP